MSQNESSDLLHGSIPRALLRLSLPVMITVLLQTLYNIADAFWLGKLGREAISAPGISFPILFFFVSFGAGFSVAGTTLVAQYSGSGQREQANLAAGQTLIYLLIGATFIALVGVGLASPILRLMRTPADVFVNAQLYLQIIFAGIPFMAVSFVYGGIMRGVGDSVTPMLVDLVANLLNIILDPFLIFGWGPFPRLEVAGAAWVTIFTRVLASALCLILLFRGRSGLTVRWPQLRPQWQYLGRIARIGVPAAVGQSGASLGFMVTQGMVNTFGSIVVSAYTVGVRIIQILNVPAMGISAGATALIGQNLGADQEKRAEQAVWWATAMVSVFLVVGCSLLVFYSGPFIRFFIDDPQVLDHGMVLFRIVTPSIVFFGIILVIFGAFQGAGKTSVVMVLSIGRLWLLRIPIAYLAAYILGWGPKGIYWGMFISNAITFLVAMMWFRRGSWRQKVI